MKSKNTIYIAFIILAISFWNPLTFFFVYRNFDIHKSNFLKEVFGLITLSGFILIFLISKNKLSSKKMDITFLFSFSFIAFAFFVGLNILVGNLKPKQDPKSEAKKGLIFEPGSRFEYKTAEFDFEAKINSLGLRDTEIAINKTKTRILCFGDSWTFGWGVDMVNSWPKKLESLFKANGKDVEVINCGQPGICTATYKEHLRKAVPLLKPDIVLVGVLQLDDLAQLGEYYIGTDSMKPKTVKIPKYKTLFNTVLQFFNASFCNYASFFKKGKVANQKDDWSSTAEEYIAGFSNIQRLRYLTLDDSLRYFFEHGNLNSGMLPYIVNLPDRNFIFNDPNSPVTRFAIPLMKKDFEEMKRVCDSNHGKLLFINLPCADFTGHKIVRFSSNDVIDAYLQQNNHIDSIYNSIAKEVNIDYFEMTKVFKALPDKSVYFYKYDGHPTKDGYTVIAENIYNFLENDLNNVKTDTSAKVLNHE